MNRHKNSQNCWYCDYSKIENKPKNYEEYKKQFFEHFKEANKALTDLLKETQENFSDYGK